MQPIQCFLTGVTEVWRLNILRETAFPIFKILDLEHILTAFTEVPDSLRKSTTASREF